MMHGASQCQQPDPAWSEMDMGQPTAASVGAAEPPPWGQWCRRGCAIHAISVNRPLRLRALRLHDLRMVQLAGITQALREVIRPDAVKIDARHRENGVQVLQHGHVEESEPRWSRKGAFRNGVDV